MRVRIKFLLYILNYRHQNPAYKNNLSKLKNKKKKVKKDIKKNVLN